jgi:Uma2 family endonuclease
VIEVSDTTLRFDRNTKVPYYAQHGIAEVWLVNLPEEVIEVYRNPEGGVYQESIRLERGDTLSAQAFPDVQLTVEEMLG